MAGPWGWAVSVTLQGPHVQGTLARCAKVTHCCGMLLAAQWAAMSPEKLHTLAGDMDHREPTQATALASTPTCQSQSHPVLPEPLCPLSPQKLTRYVGWDLVQVQPPKRTGAEGTAQISLMVRSEGQYSAVPGEDTWKDCVLRFSRARLLASTRLRRLELMISEMNFLQSTHTSVVLQSSTSSLGNCGSSSALSTDLDLEENLAMLRSDRWWLAGGFSTGLLSPLFKAEGPREKMGSAAYGLEGRRICSPQKVEYEQGRGGRPRAHPTPEPSLPSCSTESIPACVQIRGVTVWQRVRGESSWHCQPLPPEAAGP